MGIVYQEYIVSWDLDTESEPSHDYSFLERTVLHDLGYYTPSSRAERASYSMEYHLN
jgi:hypothetical protein